MSVASEQDFRERSFEGAQLQGASFEGADLRGANLANADLRGADLSRVRCGMSRRWAAIVAGGSLLLSVAVGALSGWGGHLLAAFVASDSPRRRLMGIFVSLVVLLFVGVGLTRGLRRAVLSVLPGSTALAVVVGLVAVLSGMGHGTGALLVLAFVALAVAVVVLSVFARVVAGSLGNLFFFVVALSGALTGRFLGGGVAALIVAIGAMLIARKSAGRQAEFPLITRLNAAIASHGGTRLRDANLEGATFERARLFACDFRGASMTGARFDDAEVRLCRFDTPIPAAVSSRRRPGTTPTGQPAPRSAGGPQSLPAQALSALKRRLLDGSPRGRPPG